MAPRGRAPLVDELHRVVREGGRCPRPSQYAFFMLPDGRLVPMPCGRGDCPGCSTARAVENALVVALDAQEGQPPDLGLTLTTSDPFMTSATFREGMAAVFKRLRRRYGAQIQYLALIEFTTGTAERSGGHRRIHAHVLVKGLPASALDQARDLIASTWRASTGSTRIELEELRTPAAAIAYFVRHHRKLDQRPPADWVGKTFRPSRGYFVAPIPAMREHVRLRMRNTSIKRRAWDELRELLQNGLPEDVAAELAGDRIAELRSQKVIPVKVRGDGRLIHLGTGEIVPDPIDQKEAA